MRERARRGESGSPESLVREACHEKGGPDLCVRFSTARLSADLRFYINRQLRALSPKRQGRQRDSWASTHGSGGLGGGEMKSGFDYARQAAKAEQERLQARALELSQKLSKQSLDRRETQMYTEELYSVTERLTLTQHSLDTWVEQEAEAAASASDRVDDAPKQPQIRQSPMLQALVKRSEDDDNDAERKRLEAKPLGHRLLAAFRKHVRPTLEEQLEGLDSPFQPPSIISAPLERTLRDHMREVRKEWDASFSSGDDSRPSMSHEFGRALVELLRALAHEQRLHIPRGGIEALRERVRRHCSNACPPPPPPRRPTLGGLLPLLHCAHLSPPP